MNTSKKIVLFGELMMRLGTKGVQRILQANEFEIRFTGAEANVGVSCVNYGMKGYVVSKVPEGDIGQACLNYLARYGLDTSFVARGGQRLGLLYTETGHSQRASKVIYDRSYSSFTELSSADIDWETVSAQKGNKTKAAEILGIGRKTLHRKLPGWSGEEEES